MKAVIMMKVTKINPQGYCKGVILAIKKVLEVINNSETNKPTVYKEHELGFGTDTRSLFNAGTISLGVVYVL